MPKDTATRAQLEGTLRQLVVQKLAAVSSVQRASIAPASHRLPKMAAEIAVRASTLISLAVMRQQTASRALLASTFQ